MKPFSLNIKGSLRYYTRPTVMGILNVTPDSFHTASRKVTEAEVSRRAEEIIAQGGDFIDVGACSTRPGSDTVDEATELQRLRMAIPAIRRVDSNIPLSVDTFRSRVALEAVDTLGADIINDISGGLADDDMFATVARLRAPYILMHMRGTPATMATLTDYSPAGVTASVASGLSKAIHSLTLLGVSDIIVDPGFGFAKTVEQNYTLLRNLRELSALTGNHPLLAGLSRKSMFQRPMNLTAAEVLPATIAANTVALLNGAAILRVHDVAEAVQATAVVNMLNK